MSTRSRTPLRVPVIFAPLAIPIFLIVALLSYPYGFILRLHNRRKERNFAHLMRSSNRVMAPADLFEAIEAKRGTLIAEWFALQGPVRWWWTGPDIQSVSPYKCSTKTVDVFFDPEFQPFCNWCRDQYLTNGKALFVSSSCVPEMPDVPKVLAPHSDMPIVVINVQRKP